MPVIECVFCKEEHQTVSDEKGFIYICQDCIKNIEINSSKVLNAELENYEGLKED